MRALGFGLSHAVPDTANAAWGARFIINMDGYVDFVHDRTDVVGDDDDVRKAFLDKLNRTCPLGTLRRIISEKIKAYEISTRDERDVVLFDDDGIKIVGNSNASYGYFYVAAFPTTPDDSYTIVEVDGGKVAETRRFTLGADS